MYFMNIRKKYCYAFLLLIAIAVLHIFIACRGQKLPAWIIKDIHFATRDGLQLESYLLQPENITGKYSAVACFHQCWGNRDDYLKLLPYLAEAGIIAIVPNYPRLAPTLDKRRYTDLIDTLDYIESRSNGVKKKL